MTITKYQRRLAMLMSSDAPVEKREKAIKALKSKYFVYESVAIAKQQIEESKPDISDIGGVDD